MNFPMLKMLAEGKKKAADMDTEMSMDMEIDTSMEPEVDVKKPSKKDKGEPAVDKAAVLKFLKSCDPECREEICDKLQTMVAADGAGALKKKK